MTRDLAAPLPEVVEIEKVVDDWELAHPQRSGRLAEDSSDTEPDEDARPRGYGPRGTGEPMLVGAFERQRHIVDGAGICSLGRWAPWNRPAPVSVRLVMLRKAILEVVDNLGSLTGKGADVLFDELARGGVTDCPFPEQLITDLSDRAMGIFDDTAEGSRPRRGDRAQPLRIRLIQAILREADDPDVAGMEQFARGIRIGVGVRMPRTPAVYLRKTRWRLRQQKMTDGMTPTGVEAVWRDNYRPAVLHGAEVAR